MFEDNWHTFVLFYTDAARMDVFVQLLRDRLISILPHLHIPVNNIPELIKFPGSITEDDIDIRRNLMQNMKWISTVKFFVSSFNQLHQKLLQDQTHISYFYARLFIPLAKDVRILQDDLSFCDGQLERMGEIVDDYCSTFADDDDEDEDDTDDEKEHEASKGKHRQVLAVIHEEENCAEVFEPESEAGRAKSEFTKDFEPESEAVRANSRAALEQRSRTEVRERCELTEDFESDNSDPKTSSASVEKETEEIVGHPTVKSEMEKEREEEEEEEVENPEKENMQP